MPVLLDSTSFSFLTRLFNELADLTLRQCRRFGACHSARNAKSNWRLSRGLRSHSRIVDPPRSTPNSGWHLYSIGSCVYLASQGSAYSLRAAVAPDFGASSLSRLCCFGSLHWHQGHETDAPHNTKWRSQRDDLANTRFQRVKADCKGHCPPLFRPA